MNAAPRLLISTASLYRFPIRESFRHFREAGYDAVEVMVTPDPATQDGRTLRELAGEFDLTVEAIHGPFLLITRRIWGTDPVGKIYRSTQVAEQAGVSLVVVHPPYRWQVKYRRWVDQSLAEYAAQTGVAVAVENMFPVKLRGDRGLRFHVSQDFDDLDRFPYLVLDTSHLAVSRIDIMEAYERYRTKVVHFHLSNNAGKGWDSHLPLDSEQGVLPVLDLLDEVGRDGFAGTISLELDLRPFADDESKLHDVLVAQRELCESRIGANA
jgi:sugar phosphate isomerase/epimerase